MACSTRPAVSGATPVAPFITRETVITLTPAAAATSRMVGRAATAHLCSGTLPNSPMLPEAPTPDKPPGPPAGQRYHDRATIPPLVDAHWTDIGPGQGCSPGSAGRSPAGPAPLDSDGTTFTESRDSPVNVLNDEVPDARTPATRRGTDQAVRTGPRPSRGGFHRVPGRGGGPHRRQRRR